MGIDADPAKRGDGQAGNGVRHLFSATLIALVLSLVCVHYLEESLLPGVVRVRAALLGEQEYAAALEGCAGLKDNVGWVHPATLSLTVYDKVQEKLTAHFGEHRPEVLPGYARVHSADEDLRCVADYLLEVSPPENIGGLQVRAMRYDTEKPMYGLRPGWVSGLAQGFAGQVFLAAFVEHGDTRYLEAAVQAGNLLRVPINDGGVLVELSSGDIWFEEYAQAGQEPPLILNGHLLALDFLYWMARADSRARGQPFLTRVHVQRVRKLALTRATCGATTMPAIIWPITSTTIFIFASLSVMRSMIQLDVCAPRTHVCNGRNGCHWA